MFDIKKFINGFALWKGEQFGKVLFVVILVAIGLAVYHQITRPTQTQRIVVQRGAVATGGKLEIGQKSENSKSWIITGGIQSDKVITVELGYMF